MLAWRNSGEWEALLVTSIFLQWERIFWWQKWGTYCVELVRQVKLCDFTPIQWANFLLQQDVRFLALRTHQVRLNLSVLVVKLRPYTSPQVPSSAAVPLGHRSLGWRVPPGPTAALTERWRSCHVRPIGILCGFGLASLFLWWTCKQWLYTVNGIERVGLDSFIILNEDWEYEYTEYNIHAIYSNF